MSAGCCRIAFDVLYYKVGWDQDIYNDATSIGEKVLQMSGKEDNMNMWALIQLHNVESIQNVKENKLCRCNIHVHIKLYSS